MSPRLHLALFASFGLTAVLLGAFAAHSLSAQLSAVRLAQWQTAVDYQFVHTLALGLLWVRPLPPVQQRCAALLFCAGVVLFSGSLYLLVLLEQPWLGMVTPLGGAAWLAAWLTLIYAAWRGASNLQ